MITKEQMKKLAPLCREPYLRSILDGEEILTKAGILETKFRTQAFFAQILHESGAGQIFEECLNYTTPQRLKSVWPSRFKDLSIAMQYVRNPEKLANFVYQGRMGNVQEGDGWKFRGRGLLQLTGRESYDRVGKALGVDLVGTPELAFSKEWALAIAAWEWKSKGCNAAADDCDFALVTRLINGGQVGLSERLLWLSKTRGVL